MDRISKSGTSKRVSWRRRISAFLAGVIVFGTTYYLVLPAITLDEETAQNEPGLVLETQTEKPESRIEELLGTADVGEEALSANADAAAWAKILDDNDLLITDKEYQPKSGDLIFLYDKTKAPAEDPQPAETPAEEPAAEPAPEETAEPAEPAAEEAAEPVPAEEPAPEETAEPADPQAVVSEEAAEPAAEPETTETEPTEGPVTIETAEESAKTTEPTPEEPAVASVGVVASYDAETRKLSYNSRDIDETVTESEIDLDDETIAGFAAVEKETQPAEDPAEPAENTDSAEPAENTEAEDPAEVKEDEEQQPLKPTGGEVSKQAKGMKDSLFSVSWRGMTAGSMLDVARLNESDADYSAYVEALRKQVGNVGIYDVLDVNLISGDAADESGITITLSNYVISDKAGTALYHIKDDGSVEELEYSTGLRSVSFTTKSFSPFIFAQRAEENVDVVKLISPAERALRAVSLKGSTKLRASSGLMANGEPTRDGDVNLEVDKFGVDFSRGATETQNGTATDYVWTANESDPDHRFTFRVTYSISGAFDYDPEGIEILIPTSILVDRNGQPADYFEMSLPHKDEEPNLTPDNIFVYEIVQRTVVVDGQEITGEFIRIYNRVDIPVAQSGYIEVSYLTEKRTYEYADYDPNNTGSQADGNTHDKNGSDPFYAIISLERINIDTEENETLGPSKTDEIPVYINTNAKIYSVSKDKVSPERQVYNSWNSAWGAEPDYPEGKTAADYYYLIWEVRTVIDGTTQPYNFYLTDTFSPWGEAIKYKMQGQGWTDPVDGHSVVVRNIKENFAYGRYDYVLTRHSVDYYEETGNNSSYTVKNTVKATVDPFDQVDPDTSKEASRTWTHYKYSFNPPYGQFYMYKWGFDINDRYTYDFDDIRRYDMTTVAGVNAEGVPANDFTIGNLKYYTYVHGYPYQWTLEDGASAFDYTAYGKETVTFDLIDHEFYLKWVGDSSYSRQLTEDDYKIDFLTLSFSMRDVELSADGTEFVYKDTTTYTAADKIYIYAQFNGESEWIPMGYYDLTKEAEHALTNLNADYLDVDKCIYNLIDFKDDVNCTGYRLTTSNAHYYTLLGAYPVVSLKSSPLVREIIQRAYNHEGITVSDELDRIEIALLNRARANTYDDHAYIGGEGVFSSTFESQFETVEEMEETRTNYRIVPFVRDGVDYVAGFQREGRIDKDYVAYSNNTIAQECTYTWTVDIREVFADKTSEHFVHQSSGIIYDLLPSGSTYLEGSMILTAYDGEPSTSNEGTVLSENSGYTIQQIKNYNGTDRVLLIITIYEDADWYNLTLSTVHSWDSIIAYCDTDPSTNERLITNNVAYQTGNADIGPEASNKLADDYDALFKEIAEENGVSKFIYASTTHDVGVPLAASLGLHKKVIGIGNSPSYMDWTNSGDTYNYVYSFGTDGESQATDLILYDSLENYVTNGPEGEVPSGWHGTLENISLTQAESLGIKPVVYISTVEGLTFSTTTSDLSGNYDLTSDIWTEVNLDGLSEEAIKLLLKPAKAIAIDLRWENAERTKKYVLPEDGTVRVVATMRAPDSITLNANPEAYNNIYLHSTVTNTDGSVSSTSNNHQDYTRISYRVVGAFSIFKIKKNSTDPNGDPLGGITFELKSVPLGVDIFATTNPYGYIYFKGLLPGTYTLQEVGGPNNYVTDPQVMTIVVDAAGNVHIINEETGEQDVAGVYNNVYAVVTDGTGDDLSVLNITIVNEPRVYGDLVFVKVGAQDGKDGNTTYTTLKDVEFHLQSNGTTAYGKTYNEYRTSDDNGVVKFENLDQGIYTLTETETVDGYILSTTVYTVTVDSTGIVSITYTDGNNNPVMVPQNSTTGDFQIINEPYHKLKLFKADEVTRTALDGAEFTLTGPYPSSDSVSVIAGSSGIPGMVEFTGLKAGTYVLRETVAPPHHDLNETVYTVVIAENGVVTITYKVINDDGSETIKTLEPDDTGLFNILDPRRLESKLIILKVWEGDDPSDRPTPVINVSTKEPVIDAHYATIDKNRWYNQVNYWGTTSTTYPSPLRNATGFVRNNTVQMRDDTTLKTPTVVDRQGNTWYRIDTDDDTTTCTIYFRMNGTVGEWWSDAAIVYLPPSSSYLFYFCQQLKELDLSEFDSSKVTTLYQTFYSCTQMKSIDTTGWDTSNVTTLYNTFRYCRALTELDLNHWDTSSVTTLYGTFANCTSLTNTLKIDEWVTSSVTDMRQTFYGDSGLTSVDLTPGENGVWDLGNVTLFGGFKKTVYNEGTANESTTYEYFGTFYSCSSLEEVVGISSWDTHSATDMAYMFYDCYALESLDVTRSDDDTIWYTGSVKSTQNMFANCRALNPITGIETWKTQSLENAAQMFYRTYSLESLNLDHVNNTYIWDVSKVTDMSQMFETGRNQADGEYSSITSISVANWDLSSCTNTFRMFAGDFRIVCLDLHTWTNVGTSVDELYMGQMFSNMRMDDFGIGVKVLILGNWDMSKVTNMYAFFGWDRNLKRVYVGSTFDSTIANHLSSISYSSGSKKYGPFVDGNMDWPLKGGMGTEHKKANNPDDGTASGYQYMRIDQGPSTSTPGYLTNLTQLNSSTWPNDQDMVPYYNAYIASLGNGNGNGGNGNGGNGTGNGGNSVAPVASLNSTGKSVAGISEPGKFTAVEKNTLREGSESTTRGQSIVYDPDPNSDEYITAESVTVTFISDDDEWDTSNNADGTWTYQFDVYSGKATYYIWEDPLPGYTTDHGKSNPVKIEVEFDEETGQLIITNYEPDGSVVPIGTDAQGNTIYAVQIKNTKVETTTASLKVRKTVKINGETVDSDSTRFDFTVTVYDPKDPGNVETPYSVPYAQLDGEYGDMTFFSGIATFALCHGQSKVATDLPPGFVYKVVETAILNETGEPVYTTTYYGVTWDADTEHLVDTELYTGLLGPDATSVVDYVNDKSVVIREYGDMSIVKAVEIPEGVGAPSVSKTFTFVVTLSGSYAIGTETYPASSISGAYGDAIFTDGVATVTLTLTPEQMMGTEDAPIINITDLPVGVTYTVTEPEEDIPYGYDKQNVEIVNGENTIKPRAEADAESTTEAVVVTNKKIDMPKGGFKIIKKIDGAYHDEEFIIRVSFSNLEPYATYTYTLSGGSAEDSTGTFDADPYGNRDLPPLTIKADQTYTFSDLPIGAEYTVMEEASGYIASYVVNYTNSENNLVEVDTGSNIVAQQSISTDTLAVNEYDVVVTITNSSLDYEVKLRKVTPPPENLYVEGARLQLFAMVKGDDGTYTEGEKLAEWTSVSSVYTTRLREGRYKLHEDGVPEGYLPAADVIFEVRENGEVYIITMDGDEEKATIVSVVSMYDKPIKLIVSKVDNAGNPLPGARLSIRDAEGTVVLTWESDDIPYSINAYPYLKIDTPYFLHEDRAPRGYGFADDIWFIINSDGELFKITMAEDGTYTINGDAITNLTIVMVDPDGYELPHAGGPGTRVYTLCGLTIMLAAAIYGFGKRRKRERGSG